MARTLGLLGILLCLASMCSAQRTLTSTNLNCASLHPECKSCTLKKVVGPSGQASSVLTCTSCTSPAYTPFSNAAYPYKSGCKCSAGYFYGASGSGSTVCTVCPKGNYCPAGLALYGQGGATKTSCGSCLTTATSGAQNSSSCVTQPGCSYKVEGSNPVGNPCPVNKYNAGGNKQSCTKCPSGLITGDPRSTHIDNCTAPAGYFYQNLQAFACPQGTYKEGASKATTCTPCPVGFTTAGTASTLSTACDMARTSGYYVVTNPVTGEKTLQPCPVGQYSSNGRTCTQCPHGLTTAHEGATVEAGCLAGPGYGFDATISPADNQVYQCGDGEYKAGWDRSKCTSCGTGLKTNTQDTAGLGLSADQCYIQVGWGSSWDASKRLSAKECKQGTYGASAEIFGVQPHPCRPCPENTATDDQQPNVVNPHAPYSSPDACFAKPGYGWSNNVVAACQRGSFKSGYTNTDCVSCGEGLTTIADASDDASDCWPQPGWYKASATDTYALPCAVGTYAAGLVSGATTCTECPPGSTTQYPMSSDLSACHVCLPGCGNNTNAQGSDPLCVQCLSGTFSPGGSDDNCTACPVGQTSAVGASDSSDCSDKFMSTAPYDYLTTPDDLWQAVANVSTAEECRAACDTDDTCQYYMFKTEQDQGAALGNGCFFKKQPQPPTPDFYLAIKLFTGDYVIWPAADEYGGVSTPLAPSGSASDPKLCLDACDELGACQAVLIFSANQAWSCQRIDGDFNWAGVVTSAVKARPEYINKYWWSP